jgi:hypothetical protein
MCSIDIEGLEIGIQEMSRFQLQCLPLNENVENAGGEKGRKILTVWILMGF